MYCSLDKDVVGARLAIYPMQDNFVDIILGAVRAVDRNGLAVVTDDLSTIVQGSEKRVFEYVEEVFTRAASAGGHVVVNLVLSGG